MTRREELVEIRADHEHACTAASGVAKPFVDARDRPQVHATRGLRCHHARDRRSRQLARDDDLLLIATRQRAHERRRIGRSNIELRDPLACERVYPRAIDPEAPRDIAAPEREVLGDRRVEQQAAVVAVLVYVRESRGQSRARRRPRDARSRDLDRPARDRQEPRDRARELALPVAIDPRDADDLARANHEANSFEPDRIHVAQLEHGLRVIARRRDALRWRKIRADHRARDRAGIERRLARRERRDGLALAQHGDVVGDLANLVELVRHEDHRDPAIGQRAHDRQQARDFDRRQDRGRLVENEQRRWGRRARRWPARRWPARRWPARR